MICPRSHNRALNQTQAGWLQTLNHWIILTDCPSTLTLSNVACWVSIVPYYFKTKHLKIFYSPGKEQQKWHSVCAFTCMSKAGYSFLQSECLSSILAALFTWKQDPDWCAVSKLLTGRWARGSWGWHPEIFACNSSRLYKTSLEILKTTVPRKQGT